MTFSPSNSTSKFSSKVPMNFTVESYVTKFVDVGEVICKVSNSVSVFICSSKYFRSVVVEPRRSLRSPDRELKQLPPMSGISSIMESCRRSWSSYQPVY